MEPARYRERFGLDLVSNPHAEAAAVIAIVVVVDSQYQSAIDRHAGAQLAADQIGLAQLAVGHAYVGNQRSRTRRRHRAGTHYGTKTGIAAALGSHFSDAPAGNYSSSRAERYGIAGPHIDSGVGTARCS